KHSLVITGDSRNNSVEIQQVGNGQYKVLSNDTTINGQSTPQIFFGVTGNFNFDLKGGADNFLLDRGLMVPGNLNVKDFGADALIVVGTAVLGNVSITGGSGNRIVGFSDSTVSGSFSMKVESGINTLSFQNSNIGNPTFNSGKNNLN